MAIPLISASAATINIPESVLLFQTESWTPPPSWVGRDALVHVFGGGGSGSRAGAAGSQSNRVVATGGNAGGHAVKRITVANVAYDITVGLGGAGLVGNAETTDDATIYSGNDGEDSVFDGDNHLITGLGGAGGKAQVSNSTTIVVAAAVSGSGGDVHYAGGRSTIDDVDANAQFALGGGAAGWDRDGFDSEYLVGVDLGYPGAGLIATRSLQESSTGVFSEAMGISWTVAAGGLVIGPPGQGGGDSNARGNALPGPLCGSGGWLLENTAFKDNATSAGGLAAGSGGAATRDFDADLSDDIPPRTGPGGQGFVLIELLP